MLLEMMLASCHNCGHKEDFTQSLEITHYKEKMYILSFKCSLCGNKSEVLASEDDIKRLFHK
jgi:predicted nucleic acid-binding Zn ribbon protein